MHLCAKYCAISKEFSLVYVFSRNHRQGSNHLVHPEQTLDGVFGDGNAGLREQRLLSLQCICLQFESFRRLYCYCCLFSHFFKTFVGNAFFCFQEQIVDKTPLIFYVLSPIRESMQAEKNRVSIAHVFIPCDVRKVSLWPFWGTKHHYHPTYVIRQEPAVWRSVRGLLGDGSHDGQRYLNDCS